MSPASIFTMAIASVYENCVSASARYTLGLERTIRYDSAFGTVGQDDVFDQHASIASLVGRPTWHPTRERVRAL